MPDCSRWMPFSTNQKVNSWECHWERHQISADECPSVWKICQVDYHWKTRQVECDRERHAISSWMWQGKGKNRLLSRRFFSSVPSKSRCINPMQTWLHWSYATLVSRLFFLVPGYEEGGREGVIRGNQDWRLPVSQLPAFSFLQIYKVCSRLLAFTLMQICSNKLCHFTSQPFVSSSHCMYDMHNTRPHPCMQPVSGVNGHFPRVSPWGFECQT